ncbi:hypothetical protein VTN77DRAFT_1399 [Rasamsonia byssochlamydoides]|uniref:uncharacterized protein n=1 Tax=Rasamsonia byssochlamydoides TaxID=89139 RepID=UPI003744458C
MLARPSQRACLTRVNGFAASVGNNVWRSFAPVHGHNSLTRNNRWNPSLVSQRHAQEHPSFLVVANAARLFSSSVPLSKKKEKKSNDADIASKASNTSPGDPFDFTQLHNGIADALSRFKDDLSKLRSGGRLNPEVIENLRVQVTKGSKETAKLGELAQVVPKGGRTLAIIVGEEDLVKPINSAVIASNLSLTPQPDPHNPLQLNVPIPPPTKESREQTAKAAKTAMERAVNAVRNSRAVLHKRLQEMQKKKEARPDDVRKAHDQMEKIVEKGQKEIKDLFETAKKAIEQI